MPQHPGKKKGRKKPKRRMVVLGLSDVTGAGPILGNVFGRTHTKGQLFHKTRKPA